MKGNTTFGKLGKITSIFFSVFCDRLKLSAVILHHFLSATRDVFGFVASLEARVGRVEALLMGSKESPAGGLGYVVQGREALLPPTLFISLGQLLETLVIDPGPPLTLHLELREKTNAGEKSEISAAMMGQKPAGFRQSYSLRL